MAGPRSGSVGPQAPRLRALTPRTPEGAGDRDTWAPLTWGPFVLTEPAPQALPWSGDWTDLPYSGSVPWSRVSQALGPAPLAGSEEAASGNSATSAEGANSWSRAPVAASSTSWDSSIGPDGATYWDKGLCGEPRADSATPWGGPSGSDYTTSWDWGLHTDCTTSSKEYQGSDLTTSSVPSQQSDRATLAHYPKTNHRGEVPETLSPGRGPGV